MLLETVDGHNARKREEREAMERLRRKTGVACPKCGEELTWPGPFIYTAVSYPPSTTHQARCEKCNLSVQLEV